MKKKTHEEYVAELKEKNPNIEVVGEYKNAKTKIMHHCLIHDVYWPVLPSNALAGKGCKECLKDKNRKKLLKSHDEYVEQVKKINQNIIVLEQYINSQIPILHKCTKHNIEWKALPGNILSGQGCIECGKEKYHEKRCKKNKDYIDELSIKNINVVPLEEYINARTPILHKCIKHNVAWKVTPGDVLAGHGCPKCHKERIGHSNKISHAKYVEVVAINNPDIEVVDEYINIRTPITHRCKIHNIEWKSPPASILLGSGCSECKIERISDHTRLTDREYIERLHKVNPNILVVGKYINIKTPIAHKCLVHDIEWITTPGSVLQGTGCPKCGIEKISAKNRKSHEQYISEVKEKNPSIIVLEEYVDINIPILHKCSIDGCEWKASPNSILRGAGCPQCHESRMERITRIWLESHQIKFERNKKFDGCIDKKQLSYDFYLPFYNTNIECQGMQHYKPVEYFGGNDSFLVQQRHDKIKREYCFNNNIRLLEIAYYEDINETLNNFLLN